MCPHAAKKERCLRLRPRRKNVRDHRNRRGDIVSAAAKAKAKDRVFQESALYMTQYFNAINFERSDKYDMGVDPFSAFVLK